MDDARFDIAGEIDGDGVPNDRQWKIAVQKLLIDRFQLQLHHEKREMTAFALVIAKGGLSLRGVTAMSKPPEYELLWRAHADHARVRR